MRVRLRVGSCVSVCACVCKFAWESVLATHVCMRVPVDLVVIGGRYPGIKNPGEVTEHGGFLGDCNHISLSDSAWHRVGATPSPPSKPTPVPNATFSALGIPAGQTVTIRVALSIAENTTAAAAVAASFARSAAAFDSQWAKSYDSWQERWAQAFQPNNGYVIPSFPSSHVSIGVVRYWNVWHSDAQSRCVGDGSLGCCKSRGDDHKTTS